MRAVKFTLSGKTAFFKKPDVNTYLYFTYGQIHKVALLGIIGATVGLKGYGQQTVADTFPEFYDRLRNLQVAIRPEAKKGYFSKKIQTYNNSVGYASKEQGGNLVTKEQWLENPKWTVFVLTENHPDGQLIETYFTNKQTVYYPYLGRNDHFAMITDVEVVDIVPAAYVTQVDTLFKKSAVSNIVNEVDLFGEQANWKYEEFLPVTLVEETNLYTSEAFVLTNMAVEVADVTNFYMYQQQTLYFM